MKSTWINGIRVFSFSSPDELIDYVEKEKKSLIAINADKILHATEQTRNLINKNIGYPDGIGAVKALRKKGFKNAVKIPGVELWHEIVKRFYQSKTFFLVGGTEEVITKTTKKLKTEFQGINIIGYRNGYIKTEEEQQELIQTIDNLKPDIVFVAMGSPKQELLMQELQQHHPAIYQGLGGSFDVYVGNVKRAPSWWVNNNLEGAYRLLMQPYKIKRYIKALPFWWNLITGKYN